MSNKMIETVDISIITNEEIIKKLNEIIITLNRHIEGLDRIEKF